MKRIYVSPSTQERNIGVGPFGTEEEEMNRIADQLVPLLIKDGRFVVGRNLPVMDVAQIAFDSNNFKADLHLPIHSNAGGGEGTEVFAYGPGTESEKFAKALYNQIAPLSPGKDRGVKFNKALYEVGDKVNATSALIELDFHDDVEGAAWIASNHQSIANALYKGICDYFGYDYRALVVAPVVTAPVVPVVIPDPDMYLSVRVRVSKADALVQTIQGMGYATKKLELA